MGTEDDSDFGKIQRKTAESDVGETPRIQSQQTSPLPSPEGLVESGARGKERESDGPGEKIAAEALSKAPASPLSDGIHEEGSDTSDIAHPPYLASDPHEDMRQQLTRKPSEEDLKQRPNPDPSDPSKESTSLVREQEASKILLVPARQTSEVAHKAREQAKRLTLEVARLRSSLRACTSELNLERSNRVRLEVL